MAGHGKDSRTYVLLLFITVFMRLALTRRGSRFQQTIAYNQKQQENYRGALFSVTEEIS